MMIPIFGPKWSMIIMNIPAVVGWLFLLIAKPLDDYIDPIWLFYVGRILTGIGGGTFTLAAPLYVSEMAELEIRGALGSLQSFQITLGVTYVYALSINNTVNWMIITGTCMAFPGNLLNKYFICFMTIKDFGSGYICTL